MLWCAINCYAAVNVDVSINCLLLSFLENPSARQRQADLLDLLRRRVEVCDVGCDAIQQDRFQLFENVVVRLGLLAVGHRLT